MELGKKAAQIVNGFFAPDENGNYTTFEDAGRNVGKALGVILKDVNDFFTETHWSDIAGSAKAFAHGLRVEIDNAFEEEFGPGGYTAPVLNFIKEQIGNIADDLGVMWEDTKTSAEEAWTFFKQGWQDTGEAFLGIGDIINASLGIAGEYVGAFFETLIDFIAARGEIISGNVQRFILNIKASVLEGLAGLVDNLADGPMGRLLNLIGVDLAGAADTLRGKAADARDAIGEIDDKIADAQATAANGFDISANVNTSKVTDLKNKINDAKAAINNTSSATGGLSEKLTQIPTSRSCNVTIKVSTKGGTSTSSGSVTVSRPSVNITLDHLAVGGIAYGPAAALIGEYAGAAHNPEVVAPLSDLVGILAKVGAPQGGTSEEEMRLLREQNTLLRQIAQKELKLSPSTQLGQVVERSRQLYART